MSTQRFGSELLFLKVSLREQDIRTCIPLIAPPNKCSSDTVVASSVLILYFGDKESKLECTQSALHEKMSTLLCFFPDCEELKHFQIAIGA